jgi:type IV pilus assembly protein PilC
MLEPLMVVVLGLIVGFIVIALFMPLIKLLNDLS